MAYNKTQDIFGRVGMLKSRKKRSLKLVANQWSFGITLIVLFICAFFGFFISDFRNEAWVYYLIPFSLVSLGLAVIGLPLEKKNDKKVIIRSAFSIIISLLLILLLCFVYIAPIIFPFGIPPLF